MGAMGWVAIVIIVLVIMVIRFAVNAAVNKGAQGIENAIDRKKNERIGSELIHLRDIYPELAEQSRRERLAASSGNVPALPGSTSVSALPAPAAIPAGESAQQETKSEEPEERTVSEAMQVSAAAQPTDQTDKLPDRTLPLEELLNGLEKIWELGVISPEEYQKRKMKLMALF